MLDSTHVQRLKNHSVNFICHPYTARKDIGAGGDRYSYELIRYYRDWIGDASMRVCEAGINRRLLSAALAEIPFVARMLCDRSDLYHATTTASGASILRLGKRPVITTIHDLIFLYVKQAQDQAWKTWYKTRAIHQAAQKSDLIIVPFRSTYDQLVNDLKIPESRLRCVPYGIDREQFYPGQRKRTDSKKQVLFVGALNRGKGVDTLIRSWAQVVARVPNAELVLASKGWDIPLVNQWVEESPAKASIVRRGFVPEADLRQAYIDADLTVFPSRYGFGLPTLESMACGTPTVSGRTLDAPEFVGDAGLMADPNNADELGDAISRILMDDSLSQQLKQKGLEKASHYSWAETSKKTFQVYGELL